MPKDICLANGRAGVHTLTEPIPRGCGLGLDAVLPGELHPSPLPRELGLALPKGLSSWVNPSPGSGPQREGAESPPPLSSSLLSQADPRACCRTE